MNRAAKIRVKMLRTDTVVCTSIRLGSFSFAGLSPFTAPSDSSQAGREWKHKPRLREPDGAYRTRVSKHV